MKLVLKLVMGLVVLLLVGGGWAAHKRSTLSPLLTAAYGGDTAAVEKLLKDGENIEAKDPVYESTPLIYAAQQGYTGTVKLLLDKGANIEAKTNLGQTALMQAALNGHTDTVKLLLDKGATLEGEDKAKILPSLTGYPDIAKMLEAAPEKPKGK
jgi:ankyrin repeat protein